MTDMLPGLAPPASLALAGTLVGFDPSTVRMSAAGLIGGERAILADIERVAGLGDTPLVRWDTLEFWKTRSLPLRQVHALRQLLPWLRGLDERWGTPAHVAVEQPFSYGRQPEPTSYYIIGVLLVAVGEVWPDAELHMVVPGWWKARACGDGAIKKTRRVSGKAKPVAVPFEEYGVLRWARACCGYTGDSWDEADALGIVTGLGVELERQRPTFAAS